MLIQEVILENFMSYEYARVPFGPGINVVCGPNGSGKSSLLLAISVALGQSYTERSRKLSDLIRWGKDQARVTIVLDNSKRGKRRPVQRINKDQIFLTRGLRRDGKYWFELENRAAIKAKVERLLSKLGVDPDNMLIIMHQNMVEQFTVLSPQEKLIMVEAAVGLESYRQNVLQAQRKLTRISSQENSIAKLLESAAQTLNYWREQYDRYQEKKQLLTKRRFLERELAWAEAATRENIVNNLEKERAKEENSLNQIKQEIKTETEYLQIQQNQLGKLRGERKFVLNNRLTLESEKGKYDSKKQIFQQLLSEINTLENAMRKGNPSRLTFQDFEEELSENFYLLKSQNLKEHIQDSSQQIIELEKEISENQSSMESLEENVQKVNDQIVDNRIKLALLKYREEIGEKQLENLEKDLREARSRLQETLDKANQIGGRIAVVKTTSEVLDEIRVTDGHLAALTDVSPEVERMYESYSKMYLELTEKARQVAESREKTLEQIKTRMEAWRQVIRNLLDLVNIQYQKILTHAQAVGKVRLVNGHDVEEAGLGIFVGFKGGEPVPLDAYTQSGGERTTATMSFLLALQQHVLSPFRAVDEYDVHMDPKNREMIANMLISTVKDSNTQYVVLTPSQITFAEEDVNIITVQNIEGKSVIRGLA
ncbi:MAG: AAA family ATPase [Candidatus Bathyarchaeota archaeon]